MIQISFKSFILTKAKTSTSSTLQSSKVKKTCEWYKSIQINTNHAIQLLNHSYLILKDNRELFARESSTQEGCGWPDLAGDALNTFEEHSQRSISRDAWQGWWGGQISRNDYKHELDWIREAVRCAACPRFKQGYAIRNGVEIAVQVKAYSGNPMQG